MPQLRRMDCLAFAAPSALLWLRSTLLLLLPLLLANICWQPTSFVVAAAAATSSSSAAVAGGKSVNWDLPSTKAQAAASQASSVGGGHLFPALTEFSTHAVIRPQIHHARHKTELSNTLDVEDGLHVPHITLSYYHQGQRVYIDLQRNDKLLPDEHFLRYQNSRTPTGYIVKNFTKTEVDLCHYQGSIRGKPDSSVALSTCSGGVNGIVFDGIDTYFIHAGNDGRLQDEHFLLRHADMLHTNATCGYDAATDDHFLPQETQQPADLSDSPAPHGLHMPHSIDGSEFNRILRYKRSYSDNHVIRGPYNANKHSSYVELVIVVDNKVYQSFGNNAKKVHQHCKDLANIMNALYVPLNIFIALVGVVIWNESNEIEFSSDGDVTLRNFLNYRRTKLVLEHPNDNAQLLTKEQFNGGVVGKALKGPICTHEYSGGVSMEHSQIIAVVATTMAHEMGHNFGMEHDSADCKCQDEKCIMAASSTSVVPVHWSSCSIDQLNIAFSRGMNYCLRNKPTKLFDSPQCGNGFVEPGEQCDCGLAEYCQNTCCDPHTCMLHTNASCATGECCDLSTCRPKVAGTECRMAENECDLAEYCTGESEYCPADVFRRDTEECDSGQAYCYQGDCRSHSKQCRILWGPTGESSEHCYWKNTEGKRGGNCGYNRLNNTFLPCEADHVACGMLHCRHLNERLEFGMESVAVFSHSFINHKGVIVPCRTALVDLGLESTDPGLTPSGAKCGNDKMCVNQKCLALEQLRATGMGLDCPANCNDNGVCNSRGHCHCNIGYTGDSCLAPGPGGSVDSGPATNPNSHESFQRFMYIFFFAVIPLMMAFCFLMYYCRNHPFFIGGKLAENIIKSASGNKQPPSRSLHPGASPPSGGAPGLPKSTPSSTDDMNSALLKSPSDSHDASMGNGMFGQFKGFTLRPLSDNSTTSSGPNVAYVQPTVQEALANGGVPQRCAPPPPVLKANGELPKLNGTLGRKAPALPTATTAPALPPPNPGSHARPIISMPVLEASTLNMPLKRGDHSPIRAVPTAPPATVHCNGTLKPAPPPPVPLHADAKLNVKRDGTIRRIASFLKKEDKPQPKEKTYMDREKLRNIEISSPMPVAPQGESSNSDSEATSPKEDETKNLVKRTQSMRSPTKKTNVQTFGSMRYPPGAVRPKSVVGAAVAVRPKSPPPRPPPLLKKTNSLTSSGYQRPVATAKATAETAYDDCEFVELPLSSVGEAAEGSPSSADNIYSIIDEIPPAAQTLKRSDLVSVASSNAGDMGLLGEIVNEIEKRNGDSLYSASTLAKTQQPTGSSEQQNKTATAVKEAKALKPTKAGAAVETVKTQTTPQNVTATATATSAATSSYLRPAPQNAPVARVAPTRADLPPTGAFSSFKPAPAATALGNSNNKVVPATNNTAATQSRAVGAAAASVARNKSFGKVNIPTTNKTLPSGANTHSATIQKPKPLSAKPSFSQSQQRKPTVPAAGRSASPANSTSASGKTAASTLRATPSVKAANIASLSQRFEKGAPAAGSAATAARK